MPSLLVPKLCGADVELGNFALGAGRYWTTCFEASRALLRHIPGVSRGFDGWSSHGRWAPAYRPDYSGSYSAPGRPYQAASRTYPAYYDYYGGHYSEWGRKFLPANGGCVYIDLDHLELCLPEVLSAWDHVAAWHAMLRIARAALEAANAECPRERRICVLVNNSDGQGNSYGSHLDFLISRRAWDNIFHRKLHYLLFLASFQVSSVIFTGQGKVGSENGAPPADYQLSQRADFFEMLLGPQTTYRRPLVNSRDESLCAAHPDFARLHVIFFDNTLAHTACLLKVGAMQILLAMIEAERVCPRLILEDPLEAVLTFSHDPTLQARARTVDGRQLTALELQWEFCEQMRSFVEEGACEGIVPGAADIVALHEDTLRKLKARDFRSLAGRLDWVLKLILLERALRQRPGASWTSPQAKHLDHIYSSLDPSEGLYWAYESAGLIERVVSEQAIERFVHEPPENTRAWTRAMLLRRAAEAVDDVDWDRIRFRFRGPRFWPVWREIVLDDPLGWTRQATEQAFAQSRELTELINALQPAQGSDADPAGSRQSDGGWHETERLLQ